MVPASIQWGTAAATSIAIDNLLALGHHVFSPTFDSLSPLLKGVSDNEAITNKCQQASLFPAALVVSKLYSLWKELRNPVYDENGQLFAMKGLGWVTRWDSLMASIDFSIHDITAFETSALPRYPSIFRVGHLAQVSTGKRILDGQESQTSNSICLGHLAVIYNFPDWPTCTRPACYFKHVEPTLAHRKQITEAIQRSTHRSADIKTRFFNTIKAHFPEEVTVVEAPSA